MAVANCCSGRVLLAMASAISVISQGFPGIDASRQEQQTAWTRPNSDAHLYLFRLYLEAENLNDSPIPQAS